MGRFFWWVLYCNVCNLMYSIIYTRKIALQQLKYYIYIYTSNNILRKKFTGIMAINTNIAALPRGRVFSYYF